MTIAITCAVLLSVLAIVGYAAVSGQVMDVKRTYNQNNIIDAAYKQKTFDKLDAQQAEHQRRWQQIDEEHWAKMRELERTTDTLMKRANDQMNFIRANDSAIKTVNRDMLEMYGNFDLLIDLWAKHTESGMFKPAERRTARRNGGTVGKIEDVAHTTLRRNERKRAAKA